MTEPILDENQIITERREKLAKIRAQGGIAFPNDFQRLDYAGLLHQTHEASCVASPTPSLLMYS